MTGQPPDHTSTVDAYIGEQVHLWLFRRRMMQAELADYLGITSSVLSKKIRGHSAWSAAQVSTAAMVLGVPIAVLYEQPHAPSPEDSFRRIAA